ncbi:unnamed protein product [Rhodiola kirilowii]
MIGPTIATVKFLCSYGGTILPGYHDDDKLRYQGGHTRVLAVDRLVSFTELRVKLAELCGASVSVRCQLPSEELNVLVSITCDEDLANLIEEYDKAATAAAAAANSSLKIRAFLSPRKPVKKLVSPPPSVSSPSFSSVTCFSSQSKSKRCPAPLANRCNRSRSPVSKVLSSRQVWYDKSLSSGRNSPPYGCYQSHGSSNLVHNGNYWQ